MRNVVPPLSSGRKPPPTIGISPRLFYGVTTLLLAVNAALILFLSMNQDITRLFGPADYDAVAAYETRIADLRTEIDRLNSRQYAREGDINLQLHDLVQQQEDLSEQQQIVRSLNHMAEQLGLVAAEAPAPIPAAARGVTEPDSEDTATLSLDTIGAELAGMAAENHRAMTSLADLAKTASDKVSTTLGAIGIAAPEAEAMGGPFIPASAAELTPLTEAANAVALQLRRYAAARDAAADAPVHRPLVGAMRLSSPFGVRTDPFSGEGAFHSGMDFASPKGTKVFATGAGKITFAGEKSGYGNLVEIDHGDGIVSRYGHLSAILVSVGDMVETGGLVGKVGSTGRSTGPHLHFEIRRSDKAVDPNPFLKAGKALQAIL